MATSSDRPPARLARKLERIDHFTRRLRSIPRRDRDRIWGMCMAEIRWLRTGWFFNARTASPQRGYSEAYIRWVLTRYRRAVRATFGDRHTALIFLKPSAQTQAIVHATTDRRVRARHRQTRPLDADRVIAIALEILKMRDNLTPLVVTAALLLLTGRRSIEVLKVGHFKAVGRREILFSGQAKTRSSPNAQTEPYRIPVLAAPALIVDSVAWVRRYYPLTGLTNDAVHDRCASTLSRYARRIFTDAAGVPIAPSDLRDAYAAISYARRRRINITYDAFTAAILGHAEDDFTSALSYQQFHLTGQQSTFAKAYKQGPREVIAMLRKERAIENDPVARRNIERRIAQFDSVRVRKSGG